MTTTLFNRNSNPRRGILGLVVGLAAGASLLGCTSVNPSLTYDSPLTADSRAERPHSLFAALSGANIPTRPSYGATADPHSFGAGWDITGSPVSPTGEADSMSPAYRAGLDRSQRVVAWYCGGEIPADVWATVTGQPVDPSAPTSACLEAAVAGVRDLNDGVRSTAERRHDRGKAFGLVAGAISCALAPPIGCAMLTIGGAVGGLATAPDRHGS